MAKAPQLVAVVIALVLILSAAGYGITRGLTQHGFQQFTSSTKGYTIDYPTGWVVERDKPVLGTSDNLTTDNFVSPDKKATVDVECVRLTRPLTIDDFLENQVNALNLGGVSDLRIESARLIVAATEAPLMDYYSFTTQGSTMYFTTALIVKDCGWLITIGHTDTRTYRDLFERIARSFQPQ